MGIVRSIALIAGLFLMLAQTARVSAQEPAATPRAGYSDTCAGLPDRLSFEDRQYIAKRARKMTSIVDFRKIEFVDLASIFQDAMFALTAIRPSPDAMTSIIIPEGFYRFQCDLMVLHYYAWLKKHDVLAIAGNAAGACAQNGADEDACLEMAAHQAAQMIQLSDPIDQSEAASIRILTTFAMSISVLHEYAHIELGHLDGASRPPTAEVDADAHAMIQSLLAEKYAATAAGAFAVMGFSDKSVDSDDPHGRFMCRAGTLDMLMGRLGNRISFLMGWADDTSPTYDTYRKARGDTPLTTLSFLTDSEKGALAKAHCPLRPSIPVPVIEADLDALLAATDALAANGSRRDPLAYIDILRAIPLKTPDGRQARTTILAMKLRHQAAQYPGGERATAEALLNSNDDIAAMSARTAGNLTDLWATMMLDAYPASTPYIKPVEELTGDLSFATRVSPFLVDAYVKLMQLDTLAGRCPSDYRQKEALAAAAGSGDPAVYTKMKADIDSDNSVDCATRMASARAAWVARKGP